MAPSHCVLGIMLQYLLEIFVRYEIAPGSGHAQ